MIRCVDCKEEVDPTKVGVYRKVEGWEKVRYGGGANLIIFRRETGELLCSSCGEARKVRARLHVDVGQTKLI